MLEHLIPSWWYCLWKLEEVEPLSLEEMGHWGQALKQTCSKRTWLLLESGEDNDASSTGIKNSLEQDHEGFLLYTVLVIFYCCDKIWPSQLMRENAKVGFQFHRVRVCGGVAKAWGWGQLRSHIATRKQEAESTMGMMRVSETSRTTPPSDISPPTRAQLLLIFSKQFHHLGIMIQWTPCLFKPLHISCRVGKIEQFLACCL